MSALNFSGTLASVLVQENDHVSKGQLLAQLDTAKLKDTVAKSQAAVTAAEAVVALTQATVAEAKASRARMRQVAELSGGKVPAKTELETAEATLLRAKANEASARADVVQARATLKTDETNLGKATISSPVDGVVLTRKVEPGQTVAAAMTDAGAVRAGRGSVQDGIAGQGQRGGCRQCENRPDGDVYPSLPGRAASFRGATIQRVGLGSTTTDNVVTYKPFCRSITTIWRCVRA